MELFADYEHKLYSSGQPPLEEELNDIAEAVAHNVCQGRSLDVTLEVLRAAGLGIDSPPARDCAVSVFQSLTTPLRASAQTALALIGDYPHNPNYIWPALEAVLQRTGLETRFIYDVRLFGAKSLEGCELLVVLRDGMLWPVPAGEPVWWMTDQQEQAIADFVGGGGGFLALHNSTALRCIDDTPTLYRDVLGSSYSGHGPADEHFEVRIEDAGHFIAAGAKDYPAVDERHCPVMHTDDATILTRAYSDTGTSVNGYVRTYGKGRVCYLANGHTAEMLGCASMQTLMDNAVRWCSGRDTAKF